MIPLHVDQEQFVPSLGLVMPSVDVSLVSYPTLIPSQGASLSVPEILTVAKGSSAGT